MNTDIRKHMADAEATLRAGEAQIETARAKIAALRALADKKWPRVPWPSAPTRSIARGLLAHLRCYVRLAFYWPTCRFVRLAPGLWLQIDRGTSDAQIRAALAAWVRTQQDKIAKGVML